MTNTIPTEQVTIHEGVQFTPGDGAPITIRSGPADIQRGKTSITLSWTEENDVAGSAAMPVSEFERYVQDRKIVIGQL